MPVAPDYRKTRGFILRGTRADQPAAGDVLNGSLYFVTDEDVTERSNGTTWESFSGSGAVAGADTQIIFNDAGAYAGDAGLTFDKTTNALTTTGKIDLTGLEINGLGDPGFVHANTSNNNFAFRAGGGIRMDMDWNNDSTTEAFIIRKDAGATELFSVSEASVARIESAVANSDPELQLKNDAVTWRFACMGSNGDPFEIIQSGVGTALTVLPTSLKVGINNGAPQKALHIGAGADACADGNPGVYIAMANDACLVVRNCTANVEFAIDVSGTEGLFGSITNHPTKIYAGAAERIGITTAGAVRFNNYTSGAATFDASGNITATSDERLKDILGPFTPSLTAVMGLRPILHRWKPISGLDPDNIYAAFTAQNVLQYVPEAVGKNLNGQYSLNPAPILAAVVNAVQELTAEIDELRALRGLPVKVRTMPPVTDETRVVTTRIQQPAETRN